MENAVEALEMAFAVLVFILALALSMSMFSQARATSDMVLKSADETSDYDYDSVYVQELDTSGNRIVGYETIIPTVYKYDKERYKVTFKKGTYDATTGNVTITGNLEIYKTDTTRKNWNKSYVNDWDDRTTYNSTYNELRICSFDIVEETQRNESWVGSSEQIKLHLDAIFGGTTYQKPQYSSGNLLNYSSCQLAIKNSGNKKFVEQVGEYTVEDDETTDETGVVGNKTTTKRIITYILIN